jgi:hypothetical protein
MQQQQQPTHI